MTLQFGVLLPQGWTMDPARIKDPVKAYEKMIHVAQATTGKNYLIFSCDLADEVLIR